MAYGVQTTYKDGKKIVVLCDSFYDAQNDCETKLKYWKVSPMITDIRVVIIELDKI